MYERLRINGARLQCRIDELAQIGALPGGGVSRLAFTKADKAGREYVEARMRALGLEVSTDRIGNTIGIRPGRGRGKIVACGSHTDTVGTGGRFDGSVGVLAGLEVIETLNEAGLVTGHPLAVLSFVNEEGARFMPDMMGSLLVRGDLTVEQVRGITGFDGTSVGENIDRFGFGGEGDLGNASVACYIELHIEQGPVLERQSVNIGVVEGVQGIRWIAFTLHGAAAHAGATPIGLRHDAGYVAGAIIQHARRLSLEVEGQRATVGCLNLFPNLVNVVAEDARLTVDLRNPDLGRLRQAEEQLYAYIDAVASAEGVTVERETRVDVAPVRFDSRIVAAVEKAAHELNYSSMRMTSGAGHDAQIMAPVWPAAMIFVPSCRGISHNIREYTEPEDIERGANVLLHALLSLAGRFC